MDLKSALGKILQGVIKEIIDATAEWIKFEDVTFKTLRTVGYTGEQLTGLNRRLIKETREMAHAYGVTQEELAKFQRRFNDITKSSAVMTTETKKEVAALSKLLGDDKVFGWAESMQKFGMNTKAANAWLGKGQIEAKALGLNAEHFASEMAKSAQLINRINFRSGIGGLEKMVGLAMRLGTSVETLTKHIDIDGGSFSNIEKSIDTAASLQRLGGSWAQNFSNPMEVMAEGMFDAEAAAERIAKTLEGKGTFNRATGQVDMNWYDKATIGEAAKAMGVSPDEYRTIANKQVMGGAIDQDLKKSGAYNKFTEQERDAIKNLAQFNPDSQKFEINYLDEQGNEHVTDVSSLSPEELAKAIKLTDKEKDINKNVASIAGQVKTIADIMSNKASESLSTREAIEGSKETANATKVGLVDDYLGVGNLMGWVKSGLTKMGDMGHTALNVALDWIGREDGGIIEASPTGLDGVQKFANGGVIDGGYNIGSLIAPQVKGYDSGGLVGGSSYQGDKMLTRLNSGEMVLNQRQQAQLFNLANGQQNDNSVGNFGFRQAVFTNFSTSVVKAGEIIQKSSGIVDKASNLVPTTVKGFGQAFKLAKSATIANYAPTRLLSNNNLFARFARSKVHKISPEIAKTWESATNIAESIRKFPKTAWNAAKNSDAGINAYIAKEDILDKTVRPITKKISSAKDTVHYGMLVAKDKVSAVNRSISSKASAVGKAVASKGKGLAVSTIESMQATRVGRTTLTAANKIYGSVTSLGAHIKGFGQGAVSLSKSVSSFTSNSAKTIGIFGKKVASGAVSLAGNGVKWAGKSAAWLANKGGKATSYVGKSLSKASSKLGSSLVSGTAKVFGKTAANGLKAAGPVGTAIAAGFSLYEAGSAISDYSNIKKQIESREDLTEKEKKQLVRQAQDDRNEKVGGAVGSVAGGVVGGAVGSILGPLGTAAGAAIGSFLGEKVGGFIGKSVNGIKDFLFGEKKELTEEDKAQQDYEETKFGQVGIDDPQLQEKAAMATCAMHDLLVSIWHHMNGKMSNGEEKDSGGLVGSIGRGVKAVAKGALGAIAAPFKAIGSLFGNNSDDSDKNEEKNQGNSFQEIVSDNIVKINANLEAFIGNTSLESQESTEETAKDKPSWFSSATKNSIFGIGSAISPLSILKSASPFGLVGKMAEVIKSTTVNKDSISPEPLGEKAVRVENRENNSISSTETLNSNNTIKLEVSGTIKLEAPGGNSNAIDMKALLDSPEMKDKILNLVYEGLNRRATGGRMDANTQRAVMHGANNR